jgi:predicted transcriptional regulator
MKLIVELDPEFDHQLVVIQKQTNQDHQTIIKQAIELYHQQIQSSRSLIPSGKHQLSSGLR